MPEARPAPSSGRAADLDLLKTLLVWGMITAHCIQLLALRPKPPALVISDFINLITFSGFMFAFGVRRRASHLIMVMSLSGFIVFMILLIYQLDQPFSGILSVGTGDFGSYFNGA